MVRTILTREEGIIEIGFANKKTAKEWKREKGKVWKGKILEELINGTPKKGKIKGIKGQRTKETNKRGRKNLANFTL